MQAIHFPPREIKELIKAWLALSLAFTILLVPGISLAALIFFIISMATVGLGFLLHELAHKITAQKYGHEAEFAANNTMLMLAIAMSFIGFIFAAPGAVYIHGHVTKKQNGLISIAGPLTNLALALLFLPIKVYSGEGILGLIGTFGFMINAWLGLFNMIPVMPFDGAKIIKWNKPIYFLTVAILLTATIYSFTY